MTDVADLKPLPGPYEILELTPGQTITLRPKRWETGRVEIHPRDGREPKQIAALRVHVPAEDKPTLPHYWDITSQHLVAGLIGQLEGGRAGRQAYRITKHGGGPQARFTLEVVPGRSTGG